MKKLVIIILYLFLGIGVSIAQTRTIKGLVVDETNEPIIGATVSVKGSTTGTITDTDGKFTIQLSQSVRNLTFSYVGYLSQDVVVSSDMKVALVPSAKQLGEVVVTGMNVMDRRTFAGSADRLNAEDIALSGIADISRSLEGRSAGVSVQNITGTFGTAPRIRVRGATSIYGNSKPLWVVDGVIMDDVTDVGADDLSSGDATTLIASAIAGLNADDIESFDILKDGSATSIYGARAMAGVIVVTTKRGRPGHSKITYTGEYTTRMIPSYNEFNIMNSQEQMGLYKEMKEKGWLNFSDTYRRDNSGVYGHLYQLINQYKESTGGFEIEHIEAMENMYLRDAEMRNTDWFNELFSTSIMHNHSVGITSGTDKTSIYGSLSALIDPGWYKQSKVNRYTANMNLSHRIKPNLSLNMITNGSYRKQRAPGTLNQDVDGVYGQVKRDFDLNPYSYALNTSRAMDPNTFYTRNYAPFNILHELDNNYMDVDVAELRFQMEMQWEILPQLRLSALGAVKYNQTGQHHHIKDNSNQAEAYRAMGDGTIMKNNPLLYTSPEDRLAYPITILPEGGIYQRKDYKLLAYDFRASATYSKTINQVHTIDAFGGMEIRAADRNNTYFNGWGLQYDMGEIPFYVYQYFKKGIEQGAGGRYYSVNNTRTRDVAFFGQGTYGYDNRYSLSGTLRYEGSNKMGASRKARWLPTWNLGGAWNISNEQFMNELKSTISHLKFRASYSLTAERGPSWVTNSQVIINSTTPYRPFTSVQEGALQMKDQENSELTYEKKHEFSTAVEAGFLNNRFNMVFEYYNRNNYDLIGLVQTQGIGGTTAKYANAAKMKSYGYELTLGSRNIETKDFTWNTDFIFGYTHTEVTKLDTRANVITLISGNGFTKVGYPQRALFSIPFVGLNQYGYPMVLNQKGEVTSTSMGFQEDIKTDFLIYEGPSEPTHTGSLQNTFRYKNFRLNVFMTYAFGNVVRLNPVFHAYYSDLDAMPREFKNRWVLPGDEKYTNIPVTLSYRQYRENTDVRVGYNSYNYTPIRTAKGDFIRMKEISLTYNFPKEWLKDAISDLSLKFQASNLFLIYADKKLNGQDPEFFNSGGVSSPLPKQFTLTLKFGI